MLTLAAVARDGPGRRSLSIHHLRFPQPRMMASVLDRVCRRNHRNDRLVAERVARLPKTEWVYGVPNASVVMASFLHAAPDGLRFTTADLNGWYAAFDRRTAIAEVAHHLRREAINMRSPSLTLQYRTYSARLAGQYQPRAQTKQSRPMRPLNVRASVNTHGFERRSSS